MSYQTTKEEPAVDRFLFSFEVFGFQVAETEMT
jgi:hypothetical protein